jgi:hypothetical protein
MHQEHFSQDGIFEAENSCYFARCFFYVCEKPSIVLMHYIETLCVYIHIE